MNGCIKYVHYGSDEFDINKFKKIKNQKYFPKPEGGLWACRSDDKFGWKRWCEAEDFHTERLKKHFEFTLKENAKILTIEDMSDLQCLPRMKIDEKYSFLRSSFEEFLDFEEIAKEYDAMEVFVHNFDFLLTRAFMGWDVDSIIIINPEIIIKE